VSEECHCERIRCPECGKEQDAEVQHSCPWPTYIHHCEACGYTIMESEWERVEENAADPH
jgi:ribosomal protein S27E